jgi:NADPH-dependent curcumin reductase CurA
MKLTNHTFRLIARRAGMPKDSDWKFTEEPVREPGPGEALVKIL